MSPLQADDAIRLQLLIPDLRFTVGNLILDPVRAMLGVSLEELLAPVLNGQPTQRTDAWGTRQFCYPIRLRPGNAVVVPLGPLGEMGIAHSAGLLGLSVPALFAQPVREHLGAWVAHDHGVRFNQQGALVARFHLSPGPGMRAALDVPHLGQVAVEAA